MARTEDAADSVETPLMHQLPFLAQRSAAIPRQVFLWETIAPVSGPQCATADSVFGTVSLALSKTAFVGVIDTEFPEKAEPSLAEKKCPPSSPEQGAKLLPGYW